MNTLGHNYVRTAMQYQRTELEIVRAALNGPGMATGSVVAEKFLRHTPQNARRRNPE